MKYVSKSPKQTNELAAEFAKSLHAGDVIILQGDLGAGKTEFVKGVVNYFDKSATAISPTFTIVNEYSCAGKMIYHFDFYRIKSEDELYAIGIEEYLFGDAICFIEWPERAPNLLSQINYKTIKIEKNGNDRIIEI